jgi:hypothetical protein
MRCAFPPYDSGCGTVARIAIRAEKQTQIVAAWTIDRQDRSMCMKTYIRVRWLHEHPDEPIDLWSELDGERFETRKLEFFRDGTVSYADAVEHTADTQLGEAAVPSLRDLNSDPQFKAEEVTTAEFEQRWEARQRVG